MKACLERGKVTREEFPRRDQRRFSFFGGRGIIKIHACLEPLDTQRASPTLSSEFLDTQRLSHYTLPFNKSSGLTMSRRSADKRALSHLSHEIEVADSCFASYRSDKTERPVLLSSVMQMINLVLNLTLPVFTFLHNVQPGDTLPFIECSLCARWWARHVP